MDHCLIFAQYTMHSVNKEKYRNDAVGTSTHNANDEEIWGTKHSEEKIGYVMCNKNGILKKCTYM